MRRLEMWMEARRVMELTTPILLYLLLIGNRTSGKRIRLCKVCTVLAWLTHQHSLKSDFRFPHSITFSWFTAHTVILQETYTGIHNYGALLHNGLLQYTGAPSHSQSIRLHSDTHTYIYGTGLFCGKSLTEGNYQSDHQSHFRDQYGITQ